MDDIQQPQAQVQPTQADGLSPDFIPAGQFQSDQEYYSSPEQQAKTFVEGAGQGAVGPLAPMAEKAFGVQEEDIRGRAEENPITHGAGEATGLIGTSALGVGEGAVLAKAGEAAAGLAGLGEAANASRMYKIGSSAVKGAAEMAVLQGSDETAKMILHDPNTSAETAISNIGLSAALGAGGNALITGAVSPLWSATIGKKLGGFLEGTKGYLDGTGARVPEDMAKAAETLGIDLAPELRAASTSPQMAMRYNELKSLQKPEIKAAEDKLRQDASDSLTKSIPVPIEDIQNYDTFNAGKGAMETLENEYRPMVDPITKKFNDISEPFKNAPVTEEHAANLTDRISTLAQEKGYLGQDVPQQELVDAVLKRVPNLETAQDVKQLMTTIDNIASKNYPALGRAARDIKDIVVNSNHDVLSSAIQQGVNPDTFSTWLQARNSYKDLAKLSQELGSELGINRFEGPEAFLRAIKDKISPENFINKLSPRGNAGVINLLEKNFPQTAAYVKENELKKFLAPAVRSAKGDLQINPKTLQSAIEKGMAGQQTYMNWLLPQDLVNKSQAAAKIHDIIPAIKDSGTGGWIEKNIKDMPMTAMGMIAALSGHNPITGALFGHIGQFLRRDAPDAMKLAMLRFAGAEQPVKAEGFKAMVDFLHNTYQGNNSINRAVKNVFKRGAQVTTSGAVSENDRERLDKVITKYQQNPDAWVQAQNDQHVGHYLPEHQTALTTAATSQIQYLQSLKPKPFQASPLDKPIEPSKSDVSRYNNALDIAIHPQAVLQKVKEGTLKPNDIADIHALYPSLYKSMSDKLGNIMTQTKAGDEPVPYVTRMGISLFLGQPMDTTMQPMSILAAQPVPQQPPVMQPKEKKTGSVAKLGKSNKQYMTQSQAAESDRTDRS